MVPRGCGAVLSIGSQTAFRGSKNRAVYAAAKAAIAQLTRSLAVEWGRVAC
jgi:short-subunit dehydrogenase